ncbi:MAG: CD225/dispanin family protein [Akkermansiaceae bacterium]
MSWFYSKNGTQMGPVSTEELSSKAASGEVLNTELIWKEGMPDWKPLSEVPEFAAIVVSPQAAMSSPGAGNVPITQPPAYTSSQLPPNIPNYLWQSIVATVLCCMPFGVVAIVFAAKVDGLVARGDIAGAQSASQSAKTWVMVAVGCWVVFAILYAVLIAVGVLSESM